MWGGTGGFASATAAVAAASSTRARMHLSLSRVRATPLERFATKAEARAKVAAWIEEYNHDRRHSALDMLSPIAYERSRATVDDPPEQAA